MRDSTKGILLGIVGTLVLGAGVGAAWVFGARQGLVLTDGSKIRVPAAAAPVREVLWEPADLLPAWINQGDENYEPRLTPDGRTLLFVRGKAGGGADVFAVERTRDGWGSPFALAGVNTQGADELGPTLSADGRTLYFYSDREGGQGGYDLWSVQRIEDTGAGSNGAEATSDAGVASDAAPGVPPSLRDATWGSPQNLGPEVNSPFNDYGPAPAPDGSAIYFASNRPKQTATGEDPSHAWPATVREDLERRDYDLFVAPLTDRGAGRAQRIDSLTTTSNEGTPAVSPAGDFLYFASDRPGGAGGLDLYRARLGQDRVLLAENLRWPINSPANELDPALSMNGFALHFSSNREGSPTPRYAIYSTLSREVYRQHDPLLAGFSWGAAWNAVWPWLLLLGLIALLFHLVNRFLRDEDLKKRWRRLSLIAKCLVLSLMMHALLAMLFTVWYVSGSVGELLRGPGGTRVALVSRGVGSGIASQIRGGLTELTVRSETTSDLRATPALASEARMIEARFAAEAVESSDQSLDPAPVDAASEAAPDSSAPELREPSIQALATSPRRLATPEAQSAAPASEAQMQPQAQAAPLPTSSAAIPASTGASAAQLGIERVAASESALASNDASAATDAAAPIAAGPAARPNVVPVDLGSRSSTNVATPAAQAGDAGSEREMTISPLAQPAESSAASPAIRLNSTGSTGAPASMAPERTTGLSDSRLSASDASAQHSSAGPAASARPSSPARPDALAIPALATQPRTALPTASQQGTGDERTLSITTDALPAAAPSRSAIQATSLQSDGPVRLAPSRLESESGSASDSSLANSRPVNTEASAPSQRSPADITGTIHIDPASSDVRLALPSAASQSAAPGEESQLDTRPVLEAGSATTRPALATDTEAGHSQSPSALPLARIEAPVGSERSLANGTGSPTSERGSDSPAGTMSAPAALAISIDPGSSRVPLALPGAGTAASTSGEEPQTGEVPLSDPSAPARPDLPPTDERASPSPTSLAPERAGRAAEPDRSLASPSDESTADRRAEPASRASAPPISSSIPIDLSTLSVPLLALPAETEESAAQAEPLGTLVGVVTDSQTHEPISGARIRLDLPDSAPLVARTNLRGQYRLRVPADIPDNVAISATAPGYTPASINVAAIDIEQAQADGGPLSRDFDLTPLDWDVIPIEADPQVRHLGNDEFEGAINSQFQRSSEGLEYRAEFRLDASQVHPAIRSAELLILAKGAQAQNPIRINGRELEAFIVNTPSDGSFGELVFRVPPRWLRQGMNTIQVQSVRGSNDLDDFEFVNPRIRLRPSEARGTPSPR